MGFSYGPKAGPTGPPGGQTIGIIKPGADPVDIIFGSFEAAYLALKDIHGPKSLFLDPSLTADGIINVTTPGVYDMTEFELHPMKTDPKTAPQGSPVFRWESGVFFDNLTWHGITARCAGDKDSVRYTNLAAIQLFDAGAVAESAASGPFLYFAGPGMKRFAFKGSQARIGDSNGYGVFNCDGASTFLTLTIDPATGTLEDDELTGTGTYIAALGEGLSPLVGDVQPANVFALPAAYASRVEFDNAGTNLDDNIVEGALVELDARTFTNVNVYGSGNNQYIQGPTSTTPRRIALFEWDGQKFSGVQFYSNLYSSAGSPGTQQIIVRGRTTLDVYYSAVTTSNSIDNLLDLIAGETLPTTGVTEIEVIIAKLDGPGRVRCGSWSFEGRAK